MGNVEEWDIIFIKNYSLFMSINNLICASILFVCKCVKSKFDISKILLIRSDPVELA